MSLVCPRSPQYKFITSLVCHSFIKVGLTHLYGTVNDICQKSFERCDFHETRYAFVLLIWHFRTNSPVLGRKIYVTYLSPIGMTRKRILILTEFSNLIKRQKCMLRLRIMVVLLSLFRNSKSESKDLFFDIFQFGI